MLLTSSIRLAVGFAFKYASTVPLSIHKPTMQTGNTFEIPIKGAMFGCRKSFQAITSSRNACEDGQQKVKRAAIDKACLSNFDPVISMNPESLESDPEAVQLTPINIREGRRGHWVLFVGDDVMRQGAGGREAPHFSTYRSESVHGPFIQVRIGLDRR